MSNNCEHKNTHTCITRLGAAAIVDGTVECKVLESETVCDDCKEIVGWFKYNPNPWSLND